MDRQKWKQSIAAVIQGLWASRNKRVLVGSLVIVLTVALIFGLRTGQSQKLAHVEKKHVGNHDQVAAAQKAFTPKEDVDEAEPDDEEDSDQAKVASGQTSEPKQSEASEQALAIEPLAPKAGYFTRVFGDYASAYSDAKEKLYNLRHSEEENERLRLENSNLRLKVESLQFDCRSKDAQSITRDYSLKIKNETGSNVGRTLANIAYRPPENLLPSQLYTLGVSYFKARENEKAAVIFSFLTGLEDNDAYKTTKNLLMTGVAWYRVDNLQLAEDYFAKAVKEPETQDTLQYQAQARLWRGLVAERLGKHSDAQTFLRDLVDHHPHSMEAAWVNAGGTDRVPAKSEE